MLTLDGDEQLVEAARVHEEYLRGEVLAVAVHYSSNGADAGEQVASIEGRALRISVVAAT